MSSVRIESAAFGDDRFEMLARRAGLADADHARGKMARLWRTCTIEQRHILTVEEIALVLGDRGAEALIAARLGEETSGGIRICGTKGRIEWLEKLRKNGKKGGRPSKTKRFPSGSDESNPLALALAPSLAPTISEITSTRPARDPTEQAQAPQAPQPVGATNANQDQVWPLVRRVVAELDAQRLKLDPGARRLGVLPGGGPQEQELAALLRALPESQREASVLHAVQVLVADARQRGPAGVGKLSLVALTSPRSWAWLQAQTVESVESVTAQQRAPARAGPRSQRHTAADELEALPPEFFAPSAPSTEKG